MVPEIWTLIHYQWTGFGIEPSRTTITWITWIPCATTIFTIVTLELFSPTNRDSELGHQDHWSYASWPAIYSMRHPLRRTAPFPACPVSGGVVASARELPTPPTRRGPRGPRADGLKSLHARCDRKSGTSRYYLMIYHEILHNKQLLVQ